MANLDSQSRDSGEISESRAPTETEGSRPNAACVWTAIASLGLGAFSFNISGCATPPMGPFLDSTAAPLAERPQPVVDAVVSLERIETQLERLESLRCRYLPLALPFLALSSELRDTYDQAVCRHRELCRTANDYKMRLLITGVCSEDEVKTAGEWASTTEADLTKIFELVDHVEANNGQWKTGWSAPSGYEFIRPLN